MSKPTVVIIAGGENSRFAPLNTVTHKGFLSILGKPIVTRALEDLKKHGFENIILVVSPKDYAGKGFSEYLKNHDLGINITLVLQEKATGMGDALLLSKQYLQESFILASPYYANLGQISERLYAKQKETLAECVVSGTKTQNQELYGILQFDTTDPEKVVGIVEKPTKGQQPSDIKIDSIYLFDPGFITELEATKQSEYSLESAIATYTKKNQVTWILNTGILQSLKYPWHLFSIFTHLIKQGVTTISNTAKISETAVFDDTAGPVIIDDNATIGDFVKLVGPCYIGKNTLIGDYSFVRGSAIEAGSVVGANTEIVRSILFEDVSIHYGYLADSILGQKTKIGAGLITANKRLDRTTIRVQVKKKLIDTGTNTLGIITGQAASLGIRVNTMPGITIAPQVKVGPGTTVKRNILTDTTIEK